MSNQKFAVTVELDMDFIPNDEIQKNIVWNIARILKEGGRNSGLVSSKFYPEDDNQTDEVIPFIERVTVKGPVGENGLPYEETGDLTL